MFENFIRLFGYRPPGFDVGSLWRIRKCCCRLLQGLVPALIHQIANKEGTEKLVVTQISGASWCQPFGSRNRRLSGKQAESRRHRYRHGNLDRA